MMMWSTQLNQSCNGLQHVLHLFLAFRSKLAPFEHRTIQADCVPVVSKQALHLVFMCHRSTEEVNLGSNFKPSIFGCHGQVGMLLMAACLVQMKQTERGNSKSWIVCGQIFCACMRRSTDMNPNETFQESGTRLRPSTPVK